MFSQHVAFVAKATSMSKMKLFNLSKIIIGDWVDL